MRAYASCSRPHRCIRAKAPKRWRLLDQLPRTPNVIYLMGLANLHLGNREKARELLDESFPAAMSPAQAAFLKGKAYYDATLFDDAIREYRKARELDWQLPGAVRRTCCAHWSALVIMMQRRSRTPRAFWRLSHLMRMPAICSAHCWCRRARRRKRCRCWRSARAARPDGWGAYYYLGRARLQTNDARAAAPLLEKAASLNPGESAVFYHLSRALEGAWPRRGSTQGRCPCR